MIHKQPINRDETLYQNDMSVGDILRRTRLHYDQSIEDIERALRIRASQVDAIETGNYDQLPGRVYAIGFVRSYAEYLGLDGDKMVSLFKSQSGAPANRPQLHFPVAASESKLPQVWLVGGSLIAAVLILTLWWSLGNHDRSAVTNVPPIPDSIRAENNNTVGGIKFSNTQMGPPAPAKAHVPPAAATAAAAPAENPRGIILKIVQNSWVEIKDRDGKEVVSRVLKAGDKYFVPARPDLFMSLGNSGGVKIEIDGEELSDIGASGQVLRNIPLDVDALKKKYTRKIAKPAQ
jgi:cytoskeletal protein RodZ